MKQEELNALITEIEKLHKRNELSKTVGPDYFEPGMMENLEQFDGEYTPEAGTFLLRFEAKGTRYDGRTEQIEKVKVHDKVQIVRDQENSHNSNNFRILTSKGKDIGNMPADLCNALAPLYDENCVEFLKAQISYVEPLSGRSRHAKQAILFVELTGKIS